MSLTSETRARVGGWPLAVFKTYMPRKNNAVTDRTTVCFVPPSIDYKDGVGLYLIPPRATDLEVA